MSIVGVGETRSRGACCANRVERRCNTGIFADDHRVVRAKNCLAINRAVECVVCRVDPSIAIEFAALMSRDGRVQQCQRVFIDGLKHVTRNTSGVQRFGQRTANANHHATEVDTNKFDRMA